MNPCGAIVGFSCCLEVEVNAECAAVREVDTKSTAAIASAFRTKILETKESEVSHETDFVTEFHSYTRTYT